MKQYPFNLIKLLDITADLLYLTEKERMTLAGKQLSSEGTLVLSLAKDINIGTELFNIVQSLIIVSGTRESIEGSTDLVTEKLNIFRLFFNLAFKEKIQTAVSEQDLALYEEAEDRVKVRMEKLTNHVK
jgi:hypothetical protein